MNPYQTNWQYGYTLSASTTENRGDYVNYYQTPSQPSAAPPQQQQTGSNNRRGAGSNPHNLKTASSWAEVKKDIPPTPTTAVVFRTTSTTLSTATTTPTSKGAIKKEEFIGPVKPGSSAASAAAPAGESDHLACQKLHDLAVANRLVEAYNKLEEECRIGYFVIELRLGNEVYKGSGPSMKAAKQNAANQALANTSYPKTVVRTLKPRPTGVTSTSQLHEMATKKGVHVDFKFLEPFNFEFKHSMRLWAKEEMVSNYKVQLKVAGYEFIGQAELPQQAKHNASIQALPVVRCLPDPQTTKNPSSVESGKNVIMSLNEIAMLKGLCPEWMLLGEQGPCHQKTFTWSLKLGEMEALGTGSSKKIAKTIAAQQMLNQIPDEWKKMAAEATGGTGSSKNPKKKRKAKKRAFVGSGEIISTVDTTPEAMKAAAEATKNMKVTPAPQQPPPKKNANTIDESKPIYEQILSTNPISSLFEYCKKAKYPDPEFDCVSENVLETWQKGTKTFKKTEYTMRLIVKNKSYFDSANTKKAAKLKVATEAWNKIRCGLD